MIPLAIMSFFIFLNITRMIWDLNQHIGKKVGKALRKEILGRTDDVQSIHEEFTELEKAEMARFSHWFSFTNQLVNASPLVGLLGTVTGMIYLFSHMGSGGEDITQQLSKGISRALYPPALGLVIAMFGLLGLNFIKSKLVKYDHFFMRMELKTIQKHLKNENTKTK
jgi:biopolymer transport protein ExbB